MIPWRTSAASSSVAAIAMTMPAQAWILEAVTSEVSPHDPSRGRGLTAAPHGQPR